MLSMSNVFVSLCLNVATVPCLHYFYCIKFITVCPDGTRFVNCGFVPPCHFETCPNLPSAECRTGRCDCTPRFYIGDVDVTHVCSKLLILLL